MSGSGGVLSSPREHTAQPGRSPLGRGQDGSARRPGSGSGHPCPSSLITRSWKHFLCHQSWGLSLPQSRSSQPRFLETESCFLLQGNCSFLLWSLLQTPLSPVNSEEAHFCSLLRLIPCGPRTLSALSGGLIRTFYICLASRVAAPSFPCPHLSLHTCQRLLA